MCQRRVGAQRLLSRNKQLTMSRCIPKKVTWNAADVADTLRDAKNYGFHWSEDKPFDWTAFKRMRDEYVERINKAYEKNLANDNVDWLHGRAHFTSKNEVEVECDDGRKEYIKSDHILIATGGHPKFLRDIEGWDLGISSDGFFALEKQPKKVVIVGAGYIAMEMAGMFHALGTETHVFIQSGILLPFDQMIQDAVWNEYTRIGIKFYSQAKESKVEDLGNGWKRMHYQSGDSDPTTIDCDCLLWAIGRAPEVEDLNLKCTGVKLTEEGAIDIDDYQNTNVDGIYSIGDVCGKVQLTPVAIAAGRVLSDRLFGSAGSSKLDYDNVPSVVFAHPEVGTFGLAEKVAKEKYGENKVTTYVSEFTPTYFSIMPDEGKVKSKYKLVCVGDEERIVGLHIIGQGSSEIIQGFGLAVKMGATKSDFDDFVPVHPTNAEELTSMS